MDTEYDAMSLDDLKHAYERLTDERFAIGQQQAALREKERRLTEQSLAILTEQSAIIAAMRRKEQETDQ